MLSGVDFLRVAKRCGDPFIGIGSRRPSVERSQFDALGTNRALGRDDFGVRFAAALRLQGEGL